MNFRVGPGGQILNITRDVEQNCDFPGSPRGEGFFWGGGGPGKTPGPPGPPGPPKQNSRAFVNASLRDDASLSNRFAFESLRFRIASLRRFAFESFRFRIASLSNRFAFESLCFVASLSNRFDEFASLRI